jgi:hypothetical protein
MEEMLCAMALRSSNGRRTHHTKAGLPACCEQALKSAGEQNTHGGAGVRGPSGNRLQARGTLGVSTSGIQRQIGGGGFPLLANY